MKYSKKDRLKEYAPDPVTGAPHTLRSAAQRDSRESGAPLVNVLTLEQSVTYYFRTPNGHIQVLPSWARRLCCINDAQNLSTSGTTCNKDVLRKARAV